MSKHKEAAKSFLKMAALGKVQEAYDQYVAPSFIHHNATSAVVHIFRFEQDRVVELWDLGQPISKDSPNENGLF